MTRATAITMTMLIAATGFTLMNSPSAQSDVDASEKLLRHVVMFKFKEDATGVQIDSIVKGFGQLPQKIDAIQAYEWGVNNSPEKHDHGYTHCFLVTFKSEADRDAYLPHPAHQAFVKELLPILDEVHVVDYWAHK